LKWSLSQMAMSRVKLTDKSKTITQSYHTDLESSNLAIIDLPLRIQRCKGVRPLKSVALIFAPYCRRSSTIPMSAVSQAMWSSVHPSRLTIGWPSLVPTKFIEQLEDQSNVFPAKLGPWSLFACSCNSITLARVKELLHACS